MRTPVFRVRAAASALLLAAAALAPAAARASDRPLAVVPADAVAVGMVRIDQLKSSPFAPQLLRETDRATTNGEAARFLEEAGLDPKRDVDTAVFALLEAEENSEPQAIAVLEGRFDVAKLSAATASRGAARVDLGAAGAYYRLPSEHESSREGPGAVAFLDGNLTLAGHEPAVARVLSQRASRVAGFSNRTVLGRAWYRLDKDSSAWALVDAEKARAWRDSRGPGSGAGPREAFALALKGVTVLAFGAKLAGADVAFEAYGMTADEETRGLLEDALRGLTAAWRMAVQDRHPEMVPVIRKFEIASDDEGVSISGKVPAEYFRRGGRAFESKPVD